MRTLQSETRLRRAPTSYGIGGTTVRTLAKSVPPLGTASRVVTPSNPPDGDDDDDVDGVVDLLPAGRPATEPPIEQPIPERLLRRFEQCGFSRLAAIEEAARQAASLAIHKRITVDEAYARLADGKETHGDDQPLLDTDEAERQAVNLATHLRMPIAEARKRIQAAAGGRR